MKNLSSRNNPKIKQIHQLLNQRKLRDSSGLFVAEGIRHVGEACAAHAQVDYICYAPDLLSSTFALQLVEDQANLGIPCYAVDKETFSGLASKDNPQGILAVIHRPALEIDSLSTENFKWGVALVAPQDPGNIGSILRTIDAVGASGLVLLDDPANNQYCTDPYHPGSVRASMGSIFWYPVVSIPFTRFVSWVTAVGYHVYGTSAHATEGYHTINQYLSPLILLMGSERQGLTASQAAVCEEMVSIPMQGRVTSLNLAIASGIMLYEILNKL